MRFVICSLCSSLWLVTLTYVCKIEVLYAQIMLALTTNHWLSFGTCSAISLLNLKEMPRGTAHWRKAHKSSKTETTTCSPATVTPLSQTIWTGCSILATTNGTWSAWLLWCSYEAAGWARRQWWRPSCRLQLCFPLVPSLAARPSWSAFLLSQLWWLSGSLWAPTASKAS